jgi:hypothetical protein
MTESGTSDRHWGHTFAKGSRFPPDGGSVMRIASIGPNLSTFFP